MFPVFQWLVFRSTLFCEKPLFETEFNKKLTFDLFSLGLGHQQHRPQPEIADQFRKEAIFVKQIALQRFHSVRCHTQISRVAKILLACIVQWESDIRTSLDFEWSKRGWVANGQDFEWVLKMGSPTI